jgi:hypothetical protein
MGMALIMSAATAMIGEGTARLHEAYDRPSVPRDLAFASSCIAIVIGVAVAYQAVA